MAIKDEKEKTVSTVMQMPGTERSAGAEFEPDAETLAILADLTERAQAAGVTKIAYVTSGSDGVGTGFNIVTVGDGYMLLGAIKELERRLLTWLEEVG